MLLPHSHCCCPEVGKARLMTGPIMHGGSFNCLHRPSKHPHKTAGFATPINGQNIMQTAVQPSQIQPPTHTQPAQVHAVKEQGGEPSQQAQKYLSYHDYVALQEQLRQQQQEQEQRSGQQKEEAAGERADDTAQASTSASSPDGAAKRVPWNKGRKHSAMTIARIREGSARAMQRPEVRAKLDAWNQSRIGTKLSDEVKAKISERHKATLEAKFQNMTPEELEAHKANRSALAKRLWQDPEYAAKTVAAIQEAGRRRSIAAGKAADGDSSSKSKSSSNRKSEPAEGSSSASRSSVRRTSSGSSSRQQDKAAASSPEEADREQQEGNEVRPRSQKELAAWAKEQQQHQQQQLQQQVNLMLQTQQLIATTEQTVAQLRSNMAAFANNAQAQATAAAALQQAQARLEPAKQLVNKLTASLDRHGVHWDPSTGQITHVNHQPLSQQASPRPRASSKTSSGQQPRSGARAAAGGMDIGPDVVRSSRSKQRTTKHDEQAAADVVVSSRRRGAAAEAAAAGGSSSRLSPGATWQPVAAAEAEGTQPSVSGAAASNGHHSSLHNGNGRNGHGSATAGMYVPVQVQGSRGSMDDDDG